MTIKAAYMGIYSLFLTNYYGARLRFSSKTPKEIGSLRLQYSKILLNDKLKIDIKLHNPELIPPNEQFIIAINHRSIIDPLTILIALEENTDLYGEWVAKKELYNSPFFGLFVRNAGTILVDREKAQMSDFFKEIKTRVTDGKSVYIFPEGSRNKTDSQLIEFKGGANIMALKNRTRILPVYIKENTAEVLSNAINKNDRQELNVYVGEPIEYKERDLENVYKSRFKIEE